MENLAEDTLFKDALYMLSLVGKQVKIDTQEGQSYSGVVYVIDPIYKTVVMHTQNSTENNPNIQNTVFILRHSIRSLEILSDAVNEAYLEEKNKGEVIANAETEKRRLKKWLQQRLINVQDKGEFLKVDDHVVILPPYTINSCICNNTIVLDKFRRIIQAMPQDFC